MTTKRRVRPPTVSIRTTLRPAPAAPAVPRLPFEEMATKILSERYDLSLVLCGDALARRMNRTYRKKEYAPNVLSFPLDRYEGEIFVNVDCARREARMYGVSLRERLALLFVHGCFHLKGLDHGKKMESAERAVLASFGFLGK